MLTHSYALVDSPSDESDTALRLGGWVHVRRPWAGKDVYVHRRPGLIPAGVGLSANFDIRHETYVGLLEGRKN